MCWKCKNKIELEFIGRTSECPVCHTDLHSCKNCRFYLPGNHFDCKETVEENIADKERSNFCEAFMVQREFSAAGSAFSTAASAEDKKAAAKKAFDALFSN